MRVGVIGINHKLADLNLREKLARACQRRFGLHNSLHDSHAFILLSTCNRTEIYFSSDNLSLTHTYILSLLRQEVFEDFEQKLYSFFGYDCFCHLCHVSAGLDSAILGETEIQGQVKETYEKSSYQNVLPSDLHYLFQKSFKVSKQARHKALQGEKMPEVEHAVYQTGRHFFTTPAEAKVLFIGASEINQKILRFFVTKKMPSISICNRTEEKAISIADKYSLHVLPWEHLDLWTSYDWIILGTKASKFLIQKELTPSFSKGKLIIDLSFPRNVDPKMGKDPGIVLLNIDQINRMLKFRKAKLTQKLNEASELISNSAKIYTNLFNMKRNSTVEAICV